MTAEEKLKEFILSRYNSIREFTIDADIPYTTLDSIFKRGINNSSISNVLKICKVLRISVDALADGEIVPRGENDLSPVKDVNQIVNDVKYQLSHSDTLVIDGKDIDIESVEPIIDALDIGFEIVRKKNAKQNVTTES